MLKKQFFIFFGLIIFCLSVGIRLISAQNLVQPAAKVDSNQLLKILSDKTISGVWQINYKESDNAIKKMEELIQTQQNTISDSSENNKDLANLPPVTISVMPPEYLMVEIGEQTIISERFKEITQSRSFVTDGILRTFELGQGANVSVTAINLDEKLIVETTSPRGNKMVETFKVDPDGEKLTVTLRIKDQQSKEILSLNRIYNRIKKNDLVDAEKKQD